MRCSRCKGCMVEDFMLDMEESCGPMWTQAWRCMNCGYVYDSVLERNRQTQGLKLQPLPSTERVVNGESIPLGAEAITRIAA